MGKKLTHSPVIDLRPPEGEEDWIRTLRADPNDPAYVTDDPITIDLAKALSDGKTVRPPKSPDVAQ